MASFPLQCGTGWNAGYGIASAFFDQIYGSGRVDNGALATSYVGLASGRVNCGNPPYTLTDFLSVYPKFFGPASTFTGDTLGPVIVQAAILQGQQNITVASAAGLAYGYNIVGIGIPDGATITAINGLVVTMSLPATVNATIQAVFSDPVKYNQITGVSSIDGLTVGQPIAGPGIGGGSVITAISGGAGTGVIALSVPVSSTNNAATFSFYPSPWAPIIVIQLYINLALASVMQARWLDTWPLGMALYVAHYLTLWMETETGPNATAAQVATSGLQQGIIVSQSAGDVSASTQAVAGFDDWGSLNLTQYGVQLATFAQSIGSGPIWVGSSTGHR